MPKEVSHERALGSKTKRHLILLLFDKLETLQAYDIVKIYYDAGQGMVTDALHAAFEYVPSRQVMRGLRRSVTRGPLWKMRCP